MNRVIKLRKGLDIRIQGVAEKNPVSAPPSETYALKPIDIQGLTPKLSVRPDDMVKAGSPLFFDKYRPDILFTSPVSGRVKAVLRGERRKILEVVVEAGTKAGLLKGISRNYLDLRFSGDASLAGQCIKVKPIVWQDNSLQAEVVS